MRAFIWGAIEGVMSSSEDWESVMYSAESYEFVAQGWLRNVGRGCGNQSASVTGILGLSVGARNIMGMVCDSSVGPNTVEILWHEITHCATVLVYTASVKQFN